MNRRLARAAAAAAGAVTSAAITRAGVVGDPQRWRRSNHAGEPVTLIEGPAAAVGGAIAALLDGALCGTADGRRHGLAQAVAIIGSAAVGAYDDLAGTTQAKGFRGHLGALRRGVITSGMIKIAGVGAAALAASMIDSADRPGARRTADVMINTALTAGTANLTNLLDLRPGRAAKMIIGLGLPAGALPVVGAAAGALADDLAGRSMLGDCGANALGAGLAAAASRLPLGVRIAALVGVGALNLASEKVSFSAVIARNPALRRLDDFGRPMARCTAAYGPGTPRVDE